MKTTKSKIKPIETAKKLEQRIVQDANITLITLRHKK